MNHHARGPLLPPPRGPLSAAVTAYLRGTGPLPDPEGAGAAGEVRPRRPRGSRRHGTRPAARPG
ncbi:hypothetical protein ACWDE9_47715, partial [Streptomyces olivaceoviridis]